MRSDQKCGRESIERWYRRYLGICLAGRGSCNRGRRSRDARSRVDTRIACARKRRYRGIAVAALGHEAELEALKERYASLSCREREVMALVVAGRLNKQIAGELGLSEITVKVHRGKMMRKMEARSLPHLVNIAAKLGIRAEFAAAAGSIRGGRTGSTRADYATRVYPASQPFSPG